MNTTIFMDTSTIMTTILMDTSTILTTIIPTLNNLSLPAYWIRAGHKTTIPSGTLTSYFQ